MDFQTNKGIYKITCLVNGKFYIGSSINLKRRHYWHFHALHLNHHHNKHLQKSYNRHGKEQFIFEIIEFFPNNYIQQEVLIKEQKYLDELAPWKRKVGYNMCKNVGSPAGQIKYVCSKETRELMSKSRKGKKKPESFKQTLSEMYKGKSMKERTENPEWTSNKTGKSMKDITNDPNWTDPKTGRNHTSEAIQKMSESKRGEKNPAYGKTWKKKDELILAQTGENNHMFGKTGEQHHGFNPELITLINKQGELLSQSRFFWRSIKVDINALLNKEQSSSKGWKWPS